jgi:hypothetical protein
MAKEIYDLDEMLECARSMAHEWFIVAKQKELMPSWDMCDREGRHYLIGTPWANYKQKRRTEVLLRQKVREWDIVAYSVLTEAWMAVAKKGKQLDINVPPSKDPNRKEVVIAVATDGKIIKCRHWLIVRGSEDQIIMLVEEKGIESDKMKSWMTSLLDEEETE